MPWSLNLSPKEKEDGKYKSINLKPEKSIGRSTIPVNNSSFLLNTIHGSHDAQLISIETKTKMTNISNTKHVSIAVLCLSY